MEYLVPAIVPLVISLMFVWAAKKISDRKGFDFGPWIVAALCGLGLIGILAIIFLYSLPSAASPLLSEGEARARKALARKTGMYLSIAGTIVIVAVMSLIMWNVNRL